MVSSTFEHLVQHVLASVRLHSRERTIVAMHESPDLAATRRAEAGSTLDQGAEGQTGMCRRSTFRSASGSMRLNVVYKTVRRFGLRRRWKANIGRLLRRTICAHAVRQSSIAVAEEECYEESKRPRPFFLFTSLTNGR
jgi:hypothetical protein